MFEIAASIPSEAIDFCLELGAHESVTEEEMGPSPAAATSSSGGDGGGDAGRDVGGEGGGDAGGEAGGDAGGDNGGDVDVLFAAAATLLLE